MPRTEIAPIAPQGSYPVLPLEAGSAQFEFTAADDEDGNTIPHNGNLLLIIHNSDDTDPFTVTITSAPNQFRRVGNITEYSLEAGEYAVLGPFQAHGWKQADGGLWVDAEDAAIELAAIAIGAKYVPPVEEEE